MCVTETWVDDSVIDSGMTYLDMWYRERIVKDHTEVCVCISGVTWPSTHVQSYQLETLWIEILLPKTKPVLVCVCYRPPHQNDFYKLFELSISNISLNSEIIILGDMNTNVDKKNKKCCLIYSMHCFLNIVGLLQLITDATRITPKSSSIIDLIFVSSFRDAAVIALSDGFHP